MIQSFERARNESLDWRVRATVDIDQLILQESLTEVLEFAKTLGYNIRGKDLSFANGAVEIRRVSKIDLDDGELLSLDLLLATPDICDVRETREQVDWEGWQTLRRLSRWPHSSEAVAKKLSGYG